MTQSSIQSQSPFTSKRVLALATVTLLAGWSLSAIAPESEPVEPLSELASEAKTYEIDLAHSGVLFKVRHLGLSWCWGRFTSFEGSLTYDEKSAGCSIEMSIDPASLDTASEGRDKHVTGADFLNVAQFPEAGFRSTKVTAGEDGALQIQGVFSLHGVEKEVELEAQILGQGDKGERFGERIGFEGSLRFNRRDFGITTYPDSAIGDDVEVIIAIEGKLK